MSELSKEQIAHGEANSEAELQAMKAQAFKLEIEALEGSEARRKAMDLPKVA